MDECINTNSRPGTHVEVSYCTRYSVMSFSDKATLLVNITPSSNDPEEGRRYNIKYQQLVDSMLFINLINFPDMAE